MFRTCDARHVSQRLCQFRDDIVRNRSIHGGRRNVTLSVGFHLCQEIHFADHHVLRALPFTSRGIIE